MPFWKLWSISTATIQRAFPISTECSSLPTFWSTASLFRWVLKFISNLNLRTTLNILSWIGCLTCVVCRLNYSYIIHSLYFRFGLCEKLIENNLLCPKFWFLIWHVFELIIDFCLMCFNYYKSFLKSISTNWVPEHWISTTGSSQFTTR